MPANPHTSPLSALQPTLGQRLREATKLLHTEVERAGLMRQLLRGGLPLSGYCLLLRNLHAVYEALEVAMDACADKPGLQALVPPVLRRAAALQGDLQLLHGPGWREQLPLAPAARDYAQHLAVLAAERPHLLAAHAYVRYLGDLNGGQMLVRLVAPLLPVAGQGLAFYDFGGPAAVDALKARFRQLLDEQAHSEAAAQALVQEACSAFVRHRDLFMQLEGLLPVQPL